jgi:DNA-binding MarR family transcriptional regulator
MVIDSPNQERLAQLFSAAYERLRVRVYSQARQCGFADLRPAHSSVFRNLRPEGSRVVDLAERAGMAKQSMAYLTQNLVDLGYLTIGPDKSDGRAKLVRLTARGEQAVSTLTRLSLEVEEDMRRAIGTERFANLHATMVEIVAALR